MSALIAFPGAVTPSLSAEEARPPLKVSASDWRDDSIVFKSEPIRVSIISLYADREKLDGKPVLITGILSIDNEDDAIYMSRDTYEYRQGDYSVRLSLSDSKRKASVPFRGHLVFVQGTFRARTADRDGKVGELVGIRRLGTLGPGPDRKAAQLESSSR